MSNNNVNNNNTISSNNNGGNSMSNTSSGANNGANLSKGKFFRIINNADENGAYNSDITSPYPEGVRVASCDKIIMRRPRPKFDKYEVLGNTVNEEYFFKSLLDQDIREELISLLFMPNVVDNVIKLTFANTSNIFVNRAHITSTKLHTSVCETVRGLNVSNKAATLYTAILCDMIDSFGIRQDALVTSWVIEREVPLVPKLSNLISNMLETQIKDKVTHDLVSIRDKLKAGLDPKSRINMHNYTNIFVLGMRNVGFSLESVSNKVSNFQDALRIIYKFYFKDKVDIERSYGDIERYPAVRDIVSNATLLRIMRGMKHDVLSTLAGHEFEYTVSEMHRALMSMSDYEVLSDVKHLFGTSVQYRGSTGVPWTITLDSAYTIVVNSDVTRQYVDEFSKAGLVDAINVTKQYSMECLDIDDRVTESIDNLGTSIFELGYRAIGGVYVTYFDHRNISKHVARDVATLLYPSAVDESGTTVFIAEDAKHVLFNPGIDKARNIVLKDPFVAMMLGLIDNEISDLKRIAYYTDTTLIHDRFYGLIDVGNEYKLDGPKNKVINIRGTGQDKDVVVNVPILSVTDEVVKRLTFHTSGEWHKLAYKISDAVALAKRVEVEGMNYFTSQLAIMMVELFDSSSKWSALYRKALFQLATQVAIDKTEASHRQVIEQPTTWASLYVQCFVQVMKLMLTIEDHPDALTQDAVDSLTSNDVVSAIAAQLRVRARKEVK